MTDPTSLPNHQIQETLSYILSNILTDASGINIDQLEENGTVLLAVSAPSQVMGQIIGKEGKIIKSLRILLGISYPNLRFNLQIKD